jgi:hypothetical protein
MPNYGPAASSYQYCAKRFVQVAFHSIENRNNCPKQFADLTLDVTLFREHNTESAFRMHFH